MKNNERNIIKFYLKTIKKLLAKGRSGENNIIKIKLAEGWLGGDMQWPLRGNVMAPLKKTNSYLSKLYFI